MPEARKSAEDGGHQVAKNSPGEAVYDGTWLKRSWRCPRIKHLKKRRC